MCYFYPDQDTFAVEDGRDLGNRSKSQAEAGSRRALSAGLCNDRTELRQSAAP